MLRPRAAHSLSFWLHLDIWMISLPLMSLSSDALMWHLRDPSEVLTSACTSADVVQKNQTTEAEEEHGEATCSNLVLHHQYFISREYHGAGYYWVLRDQQKCDQRWNSLILVSCKTCRRADIDKSPSESQCKIILRLIYAHGGLVRSVSVKWYLGHSVSVCFFSYSLFLLTVLQSSELF